MSCVTLGLGSNIESEKNIRLCLDALLIYFNDLTLSLVYESEAVGFKGNNFLNMVVAFETDLELVELSALLKKIEDKSGRDRGQVKFSGRSLDIDILTYDDFIGKFSGIQLPRPEILENAYVLWPLAEIYGDRIHPMLKIKYTELWHNYDKKKQKLCPVEFEWRGRQISRKNKLEKT